MPTLNDFYSQVRAARPLEPIALDEPIALEDIQTPALVIDLDVFESNLGKMQTYLSENDIALRSHTKMHKCPVIALKQVEAGARGVCAAKVSEAEIMCDAGVQDVLVTSPLATADKVDRFIRARTSHEGLKLVIDHERSASLLNEKAAAEGLIVDVFIDIDPGMGRTGVEAGESFGRLTFNGPTASFQEQYLKANVSFGFDLVNNTENADLKNALYQKNSLVKEEVTLQKTQKNRINGLTAMNDLLKQQVISSEKQVKLLEEKMKIAFVQMKRAKLDFQNYLLHRNAYLNQQRTFLNLKKDLWLNQFAIQKEFAHQSPGLCEVSS